MNHRTPFLSVLLTGLLGFQLACAAQSAEQSAQPPAQPAAAPHAPAVTASEATTPDLTSETAEVEQSPPAPPPPPHHHRRGKGNVLVLLDQDAVLPEGQSTEAVIAVVGSATAKGDVRDSVVAVLGNASATGPVGNDVVAIAGNTYVNSHIGGDAVAIFGNLELGPLAEIDGDVVVVSGRLTKHPDAILHGSTEQVALPAWSSDFSWLRPWVRHCLMLGRPLALEPGLGWAWTLALGFLAFYVIIALLFSRHVQQCVTTLETRPGSTVLASILSLLLTPVVTLLLIVTVLGMALIPFFWFALFVAGLFGTVAVLSAIGRRITGFIGSAPLTDTVLSVLIGSIIVLLLYLVPFIGFIVYKLVGILGVGVVLYTLLLHFKAKRDSSYAAAAPAAAMSGTPGATTAGHTAVSQSAADLAAGDQGAGDTTGASAAAGEAGQATTEPGAAAAAAATPAATALPRAGFWLRMGALLIDLILVSVVLALTDGDGDLVLIGLAAYGAVMWKFKGTTIGGILCNLRVVRQDGREIDWSTAIVRALGCFVSLIFLGLGFLWIVFDDGRQSWHDKIAGTIVVKMPPGASLL